MGKEVFYGKTSREKLLEGVDATVGIDAVLLVGHGHAPGGNPRAAEF